MKPLGIVALAAAAGVLGLVVWFPRLDPSASSGLTLDRKHAVERVRALSSRYGVDTSGWRSAITQMPTDTYRTYKSKYPDDPVTQLFGPMRLSVVLIAPDGGRSVEAVVSGDGHPLEWKRSPGGNAPARALILTDFLGTSQAHFRPAGSSDSNGVKQETAEWSAGDRFPLRATLTIQDGAKAFSVKLAPAFDENFTREFRRSRKNPVGDAAKIAEALVWTAAFCFCAWILIRRRMQWRLPLVLLSLQLVWAGCSFFGGRSYQDMVQLQMAHRDFFNWIELVVGRSEVSVWSFLWLFVFAAVALAFRKASDRDAWLSLDLITQGKLANRVVGRSLAIGMMGGIAIAAVPYLVARIFSALVEVRAMDAVVAPASLTEVLQLSAVVPGLALFGFVLPLVRRLRVRAFYWVVLAVVGIPLAMLTVPLRAVAPAVVTGALLFGAYLFLYVRQDLLAVVVAMVAARAVLVPAVLLSQPVTSLREAALEMLTVGGVAVGAAVYWAVRGREPDAEQELFPGAMPGEGESPLKSDRERLQAEFQVARKAQQDALPAVPPVVEGYSLAGWCEPAQQVGGDLYDYFPLPDGRLGIAVADVSGKGVPAALYMMVTKGLLSAVSRDSNQLAYILEQINLHLYRACRKKVFVTMAAVVLDSASRTLQYGRAGHNPVVWRRSRRGQTTLVKPPGLGLGMTPGERFARSLKIEELELEPDDAIVLYSDGVTEAVNHVMEQFGEERLLESVAHTDGQSAAESRDAILRDLAEFMGTTPPRDDITLVVIRAA